MRRGPREPQAGGWTALDGARGLRAAERARCRGSCQGLARVRRPFIIHAWEGERGSGAVGYGRPGERRAPGRLSWPGGPEADGHRAGPPPCRDPRGAWAALACKRKALYLEGTCNFTFTEKLQE